MIQLLDLPSELLSGIADQLPYPDSLSLKLTCHYFNNSIQTNVKQRVAWLVSRSGMGLPVPIMNLNLKTDAGFCSSPEVRQFLLHRRKHWECHVYGDGECLVNGTPTCPDVNKSIYQSCTTRSKNVMFSIVNGEQVYLLLQSNSHILLVLLLSIVLQIT